MNITPSYKLHIDSHKKKTKTKDKSTTLQIKDIAKLTPIPTAIKIKRPEPLKNDGECKQFQYPLENILKTDFKKISTSYNKIAVCAFLLLHVKIDVEFLCLICNIYYINILRKIKKYLIYSSFLLLMLKKGKCIYRS